MTKITLSLKSNVEVDLKKIRDKINKSFEEASQDVLEEVGKETVKFMQDYITKNWYEQYTPTEYERTFEFRDSITYKLIKNVNNTNRILVYWDMKKLIAEHRNNTWSAHKSFNWAGGQKFTQGLIKWIDQGGFDGGVTFNPRRNDGGINIIYSTDQFLNDYINNEVQKRIRISIRKAMSK